MLRENINFGGQITYDHWSLIRCLLDMFLSIFTRNFCVTSHARCSNMKIVTKIKEIYRRGGIWNCRMPWAGERRFFLRGMGFVWHWNINSVFVKKSVIQECLFWLPHSLFEAQNCEWPEKVPSVVKCPIQTLLSCCIIFLLRMSLFYIVLNWI